MQRYYGLIIVVMVVAVIVVIAVITESRLVLLLSVFGEFVGCCVLISVGHDVYSVLIVARYVNSD